MKTNQALIESDNVPWTSVNENIEIPRVRTPHINFLRIA